MVKDRNGDVRSPGGVSRLDRHTRALIFLAVVAVCPACVSEGPVDPPARAVAVVARELLPSNAEGISAANLAATPIPRGHGFVVYVKNHKSPRFVWVVLGDQPYACDGQTKGLTPAVPFTAQAKWDAWKQTGLDPANTASFFQIVDAAEARAAS